MLAGAFVFVHPRRMRVPPDFVRVRPIEIEDALALRDAILESKAELTPWFPDMVERATREGWRDWVGEQVRTRTARTAFEFVVLDVAEDMLLGCCGIDQIDWQPGVGNLTGWVRTARRGQGLAEHAARLVARFGFEQLGLVRLELKMDVDNAASIRVAEKVGAMFEGVLRNRGGQREAPRPARMYSLVPEDLAG
jgi:RimJ/RimL family protein N-acetyltransferase